MKKKLLAHKEIIFLLFVVLLLFITNLKPGTYLSGWDNLQTDLNPLLGIKRAFFSTWQEYQSFGLAAGMGHAADLLRAIFVWMLSIILPDSSIRYVFQFLMLAAGSLGMYNLLLFAGLTDEKKKYAMLGALAYIFNFNIIQMLYLPFEAFSVFLAAFPWQLWIFLKVVKSENFEKRDWLYFIIIFLLSTPIGVSQQLFIVLMLLLELAAIGLFIHHKRPLIIKKAIVAGIIIGLLNSFWLMPQLYFLRTNGAVIVTSKINQIMTDEIFLRNKDKGNIEDFLAQEGFFYEGVGREQKALFAPWKEYRANPLITASFFMIAFIALLGIFSRSPLRAPFLTMYILIAIALLNNTFPLDFLNYLIRTNSIFINQIFRSPFTKFAICSSVVTSYFFAFGALLLVENLKHLHFRHISLRFPTRIVMPFLVFLLLLISIPAFMGNYISQEMKVEIPQAYFDAMRYFKNVDKNKRIALLPEYTHWGWFFHTWGYNGSGFLWYGIEQPMTSRTFDVWSTYSENYYWEVKNALEKEDITSFENVLEKYDIDYILLDFSVEPLVSSAKALQHDKILMMLLGSEKIQVEKKWDFISLFKVKRDNKIDNFVWAADTLPNIGPEARVLTQDQAFSVHSDYKTDGKKPFDAYYPFLDLTSQTKILKDSPWQIFESDDSFFLSRDLPDTTSELISSDPSGSLPISLFTKETAVTFDLPYAIARNKKNFTVTFPKISIDEFDPTTAPVAHCTLNRGKLEKKTREKTLIVKSTDGGYGCFHFQDDFLDQRYGYIVKINSKNITGQELYFYVLDQTKDQPYVEDKLHQETEYYLIGSRYKQGIGYAFSFQFNSFNRVPSINEISGLTIYLAPYDLFKSLALQNIYKQTPRRAQNSNFSVDKKSYYEYHIVFPENSPTPSYLILNQSFQNGWKAYRMTKSSNPIYSLLQSTLPFTVGKEINEHILINNWANGWELPKNIPKGEYIVLFYVPQYLQFLGYIFAGVGLPLIFFKFRKKLLM